MSAFHAPNATNLVERALAYGGSSSIQAIHEWGQYHNSRLALHVLARLSYPEDPDALLGLSGRDPRLEKAALNLEGVCALAASIALKAQTHEDRARALALFDLAHRRLRGRMPREYQELHVMTAHLDGRARLAKSLLRSYSCITSLLRGAFHCQEAHPRFGGSAKEYMRRFRQFNDWPELSDPERGVPLSIDRVRTEPLPPVTRGPLISVVMSCFKPGEALLTAVRSIVEQTWQNWELLLVDDASGPEYEPVLVQAASMDPRVKLLIQPENAGTYQARNRAMAVAQGKYITGLDSDDWAHPRRLEEQARPMQASEHLVMVESRCLAVAEDLSLMIDPQVSLMAARSTPIMIRAEAVLGKVGFYDEVRKTADSEYRYRIRGYFGKDAWLRMRNGPLTIVRHTDSTLSAGEVSRHWMSASRFAYHSGFSRWHRAITQEDADPFLASMARPRPFPIARDITRSKAENLAIEYDRIYAADWSAVDDRRRSMLADAAARADQGVTVGLLHCPEWVNVVGDRALIDRAVLKVASAHGLDFVEPEPRHHAPVTVPSAAYAELLRFEHPDIVPDRIRLQSNESACNDSALRGSASGEPARSETAPAAPRDEANGEAGKASDTEPAEQAVKPAAALRPAPKPAAPRQKLRRSDLLIAGTGFGAAVVAVALAFAFATAALPWVAAGSLAVWAGSLFAMTACRTQVRSAHSQNTTPAR